MSKEIIVAKKNSFATAAAFAEVINNRPEFSVEVQSAFIKIQAPNGLKLYVAKQNNVRRVDLSGWEAGLGTLTKSLGDASFGKVTHQMITGRGQSEDIETFTKLLDAMLVASPIASITISKSSKLNIDALFISSSSPAPMPSSEVSAA